MRLQAIAAKQGGQANQAAVVCKSRPATDPASLLLTAINWQYEILTDGVHSRLQAADFAVVAAGVSLSADVLSVRAGSGRSLWRFAGQLAGCAAHLSLSSAASGWV